MYIDKVISGIDVSIGYGKTKRSTSSYLYNNLSFDLYRGELVCLLGANGAGKSTLLRTISALQPAIEGQIIVNGKAINSYNEKDLSQLLGLVLTDKTIAGGLTVRELVELGRYFYTGFFGQLSANDIDICQKAMVDVGINHKADSYVAELSDGERQKVMIAKVLAQECPIIILDEPTAFLDIESRIEVMNLLRYLAIKKDKTILMSTHDIDTALLLADRLWLLSKEKGLNCGITEDIILSGNMDSFFKSDNILFNKESGHFMPYMKGNRKVFLESDGYLRYWTQNILAKHGFDSIADKEQTEFTIVTHSPVSISIETSHSEIIQLYGFDELHRWLKSF